MESILAFLAREGKFRYNNRVMNEGIKNFFSFLLEVLKIVVVASVIVLPIRFFLFQPFLVHGSSMEPSFHNGDYLIVDEISYRFRDPQRGEVVIFDYPLNASQRFVKRIIGLPGEKLVVREQEIEIETVKGGKIVLDESSYLQDLPSMSGFSITLGPEQYFVLGDNRSFSFDSRNWGPVSGEEMVGRVWIKLWPFSEGSFVSLPNYEL